ncbi:MAG TPA: vitamin K epoxide reductase family protein [Anaerolineales bacterium]|nr:vitamin K epoxide reductase family protein [Anaerolineales bacterium]
MATRIDNTPTDKTAPLLYWGTLITSILGTADAIYLLIFKLTGNPHMCLGNGGCHNVNFSPYSEIKGIPVSVFGICAYLAILGILILEKYLKIAQENGPLAIFGISLGGVAFSVYLTYLEIYVIHAICPFCVASAVTITLIFILAIIRLVKQTIY